MALSTSDLESLRDELDRLYKNWTLINSRVSHRVEELRCKALTEGRPNVIFWDVYREWSEGSRNGSFYADRISKAIRSIDPLWSRTWANYAVKRVLEPDVFHHPPVLGVSERDNPPSNMVVEERTMEAGLKPGRAAFKASG